METSLQAIQSFNEKSNLGAYQLLAPIPKDFNGSIHNILGDERDYELGETPDSYYCQQFNGIECITHLSISTDNYTFFGTKVGDNVDPIKEIIQKEGYQLISSDPTELEYTLNYITFSFKINAEQKIVAMSVGIYNPNELQRDAQNCLPLVSHL